MLRHLVDYYKVTKISERDDMPCNLGDMFVPKVEKRKQQSAAFSAQQLSQQLSTCVGISTKVVHHINIELN